MFHSGGTWLRARRRKRHESLALRSEASVEILIGKAGTSSNKMDDL